LLRSRGLGTERFEEWSALAADAAFELGRIDRRRGAVGPSGLGLDLLGPFDALPRQADLWSANSEMCRRPSKPFSRPTKTPKLVIFVTGPLTIWPG
jgi:hypothetical protein